MKLLSGILTYIVMVTILYAFTATDARPEGRRPLPMQPPAMWDYPYRGNLTIMYVDPDQTHRKCVPPIHRGSIPKGMFVQACQIDTGPDSCLIIFPKDHGEYSKKYRAELLRHEIAHCNGWNKDHNN